MLVFVSYAWSGVLGRGRIDRRVAVCMSTRNLYGGTAFQPLKALAEWYEMQ